MYLMTSVTGVGVVVASLGARVRVSKRAFDVFDMVDPLIGTINGGKSS